MKKFFALIIALVVVMSTVCLQFAISGEDETESNESEVVEAIEEPDETVESEVTEPTDESEETAPTPALEDYEGEPDGDDEKNAVIDINWDFSDHEVLVVIKKQYSKPNKVFTKEMFIGVDNILSFRDMWRIDDDSYLNTYWNTIEFRQLFLFELINPGKENVIKAIEQLNKLVFVYSAEPNYYISIDDPIYPYPSLEDYEGEPDGDEEKEVEIGVNKLFSDRYVNVVIKKQYSKPNKVFTKEMFYGVDALSIFDRTDESSYVYVPTKHQYMLNEEGRQVLLLELANPGKEEVLKAIKELEKLNFVYCAYPSYLVPAIDIYPPSDYPSPEMSADTSAIVTKWLYCAGASGVIVMMCAAYVLFEKKKKA